MRINLKILLSGRLGENMKNRKQALIRFGVLSQSLNTKSKQNNQDDLYIAFSKLKQHLRRTKPILQIKDDEDDLKKEVIEELELCIYFHMILKIRRNIIRNFISFQ